MNHEKNRTRAVAGTSVLSGLVIVLDYSLKFANLKLPFPWFPTLRFDFTGIPIVLSFIMYGLKGGITTSAVALLGILARSGDLLGASMKALAEFTMILGMIEFRRGSRIWRVIGSVSGLSSRVIFMSAANLVVLPAFYRYDFNSAIIILPLIASFNVAQGCIGILSAHLIYESLARALPHVIPRKSTV